MRTPLDQIDPQWAWSPFVSSEANRFDRRMAAHLFRRAAFGANLRQLDAAVQTGPATAVDRLLQGAGDSDPGQRDSDELARTILATGDPKQLGAWWTYVLLNTAQPLRERMTLFWHAHFATSADKVNDAGLMLDQNRLLRLHALGDFRALVQQISRDPAMLIYLDSATNRKARANENYARELMELFCLGEGHYTEKDVQELARCFTGWEIKSGRFRFNRFQYDSGTKSILDRTDAFPEGTAIDWIVDQPQAARFIVSKLFRQFICDEPAAPTPLLEPLAAELRENWQISRIVRRMLGSQLFFSTHAFGRKVRSPVDLAVGLMRSLDGSTNAHRLAAELLQNGQGLFFPPNVKGWDGGRAWINSSTILGRANMVGRLLGDEHTRFGGGSLEEHLAKWDCRGAQEIVDRLTELLLAVPLNEPARAALVKLAEQPTNPSRSLTGAIHAMAALPEFQLG